MYLTRKAAADLVLATPCEKLPDLIIQKMNEAYEKGLETAERELSREATKFETEGRDEKTLRSKALWRGVDSIKAMARHVYGG